jgi:hypothetical protein
MFLLDVLGALLTLITLAFLALGGYLAALRLLGDEAGRDPLALAIASLLATTAEAVGIGLLLGGLGVLRLELALAIQAGLVILLLRGAKKAPPEGGVGGPAWAMLGRVGAILRDHPALALVTAHAVGSEALRGLLRPPLSWDALMYHLLLTGTWLQDGNLQPVFGNIPNNYYGYVPANGSVWFWWWMAPSHSEFYVNLATLPQWALLGLAVGGVARQLGARRHWPLAAFLVLMTPTVVRFAATQYVDIFTGAVLVAASFFALRWMRRPDWSAAVLAGAGLGVAAGAKVLGVPYGMALAGLTVLLAPWGGGEWRRRVPQLLGALAVAALLGSFFYVRNVALGAGPLAIECEMTASGPKNANVPTIPRMNSVLDLRELMFGQGQLLQAFLGSTRPASLELGVGPQTLVLLLVILVLPFAVLRDWRDWGREGLFVAGQIWAELAFWLAVPFAKSNHVFANIRYLIPALGFAFAAAVAMGERKGVRGRWLEALALVFTIQGLLQLHAEMPYEVRVAMAFLDLGLVALALSPELRAFGRRRVWEIALTATLVAILCAPFLTRYRVADRGRALAREFTAHSTSGRFFGAGWGWLDAHGGDGTVAAISSPNNYFVYPAMGPYLSREVRYININRADLRVASDYPACQPRVDPDPEAWIENLAERRVRWIYLSRYPNFDFPMEAGWILERPRMFALRFEDPTNLVFEFLPVAAIEDVDR